MSCTAGDFVQCRGDEAITCNDTGTSYDVAHCQLGCDAVGGCITSVTTCTPGEVRCGERTLETCSIDGHFTSQACDVGCVGGEAPHCGYLQPLYLPDACDAPADALKLDLDSFNTDITSQCNGGIVAQANEPEVCVLRYATISLSAGVTAKITGRRVFALVADERVEIDGV